MDLDSIKKYSQYSYDINLQKKNALQKAASEQIVVYQNHIFSADALTICLVKTLSQTHKQFFMLDSNSNPVMVSDPDDFLKKLIQANQQSLHTYHQLIERFKKKEK
jgi:hypothetical protein